MSSTVTAAEVSKNFGAYQDAAVREPVVITKNGRPRTVLMAYEDFVRLSKRDRRVQPTVDLTDAEIAAVEASEMTPEPDHLNLPRQACCRLRSGSAGFFDTPICGTGSIMRAGRRATRTAHVWCWRS